MLRFVSSGVVFNCFREFLQCLYLLRQFSHFDMVLFLVANFCDYNILLRTNTHIIESGLEVQVTERQWSSGEGRKIHNILTTITTFTFRTLVSLGLKLLNTYVSPMIRISYRTLTLTNLNLSIEMLNNYYSDRIFNSPSTAKYMDSMKTNICRTLLKTRKRIPKVSPERKL